MPLSHPFSSSKKDADETVTQAAPEQDIARVASSPDEEPEKYVPDSEAQDGVKKVEAITLSWTRTELIIAYAS